MIWALDIANRLQRELNAEYGDDLFIRYTPDLTVGKAKGHIILMEDSHKEFCSLKNPQCTYVFGWPDNRCGYATIAPYEKRSSAGKNLFVQSIYGIVSLDHFGAGTYVSYYRPLSVDVYGDYLRWAVIESNFYNR